MKTDSDDDTIIHCAVRYCIGRRTYIVSECAAPHGWLRKKWPGLKNITRILISKDIRAALQWEKHVPGSIGMEMDHRIWQAFYDEMSI